jgi:membrane protease YdiL (CAAX protease family)
VVCFILAGLAGPTLASFVMTAVTSGKAGVRQLLRRYVLWRVGIQWYLLVLFGPPIVLLLGETVFLGATPWNALIANWSLVFTSYLPQVAIIAVFAQLLEEAGWTGFAVPRLQQKYGPLLGACILGVFWALFHLPTLFINSDIGSGQVPLPQVLPSMGRLILLAVISRIIWTWVFNNTRGSILLAILLHAASDAAISLVFLQIIGYPILFGGSHLSGWFAAFYGVWDVRITYAVCALLVLILTRGRLGYRPERNALLVEVPRPPEMPLTNA